MDIAALGFLGLIAVLIVALVGLWIYFLPGWIASRRKAQSGCAIWIVNLLFGWSVIGWILALVWALADTPKQDILVQVNSPGAAPGNSPNSPTGYNPALQPTCPNCGRSVQQYAANCGHCNYQLRRRMKVCPYCGEDIMYSAIKCRYCQSDVPAEPAVIEAEAQDEDSAASGTRAARRSLWQSPPAVGGGTAKPCPNPNCGNRFVSGDRCLHCGTHVSR